MEQKEEKTVIYLCNLEKIGVTLAKVKKESEMVKLMVENPFILKAQGLIEGTLSYQGIDTRIFSIIEQKDGELTRYLRYGSETKISANMETKNDEN